MAESTTNGQQLYSTRPRLLIDGSPDDAADQALLELHIWAEPSRPRRCLLRLSNWGVARGEAGYTFFDGHSLDFGHDLRVVVGEPGQEIALFDGEILGFEAVYPAGRPPELLVSAADRLHRLDRARRSRGFGQMTDGDLAEQLLHEHGLQADVSLPGSPVGELVQLDQSDLELLQVHLSAQDAVLWLNDGVAIVRPTLQVANQVVELTYARELLSAIFTTSVEGQSATLGVSGWRVETKSGVFAAADQSSLSGEAANLQVVTDLLEGQFPNDDQVRLHEQAGALSEAQSLADARLRQQARAFVQGRCRTILIPELLPGQIVDLHGLGNWFDGQYRVSALHHHFDVQTLTSEVTVQRPGRLYEKRNLPKRTVTDTPAQQKTGKRPL